MVSLALAAALQISIYKFNLGPVHFSLEADRKWQLSVQDDEVLIDLDRLKIRALRQDGNWSAAILPFRDQGILPILRGSKPVKLLLWPLEWLGAKSLRMEFEAKRPDYLWHERFSSWEIETPYEEAPFKTGLGQRFIIIPADSPPPRFRLASGEGIDAKGLAFKSLKLVKSEAQSHEFVVESTRQTVILDSILPPIAEPWIDGITSQVKSFHQQVWLPFTGLFFTDGTGVESLMGSPLTLQGVYSLAKPRRTSASAWESMSDRERPSLEPGLAVFSQGQGKQTKLKGMLMPTVSYFTNRLRYNDPVEDFQNFESMLPLRKGQMLTVLPGMNQTQVIWIMGWPLSQHPENGFDSVWSYRVVPHYNIVFKNGKVAKVDIGRLP